MLCNVVVLCLPTLCKWLPFRKASIMRPSLLTLLRLVTRSFLLWEARNNEEFEITQFEIAGSNCTVFAQGYLVSSESLKSV